MNDASIRHIEHFGLLVPAEILKFQKVGAHQMPEFGCGAINVKAAWRVVPMGQSSPIGVWTDMQTGGSEDSWKHWIQVDSVSEVNAPTPLGGRWDPSRRITPDAQIQDFYSVVLGSPDDFLSAGLTPDLRKVLHPGDSLILVGLHVAAKRDADWIWTTFWWSPDNVDSPFRSQMPDWMVNDKRWRHYSMNLDVSMVLNKSHGPVFNPYLEGTTLLNATTNCMRCHKNASFPQNDLSAIVPHPPDLMEGRVLLDYVWSLNRVLSAKSHAPTQR
jgi:hypothetical protein